MNERFHNEDTEQLDTGEELQSSDIQIGSRSIVIEGNRLPPFLLDPKTHALAAALLSAGLSYRSVADELNDYFKKEGINESVTRNVFSGIANRAGNKTVKIKGQAGMILLLANLAEQRDDITPEIAEWAEKEAAIVLRKSSATKTVKRKRKKRVEVVKDASDNPDKKSLHREKRHRAVVKNVSHSVEEQTRHRLSITRGSPSKEVQSTVGGIIDKIQDGSELLHEGPVSVHFIRTPKLLEKGVTEEKARKAEFIDVATITVKARGKEFLKSDTRIARELALLAEDTHSELWKAMTKRNPNIKRITVEWREFSRVNGGIEVGSTIGTGEHE